MSRRHHRGGLRPVTHEVTEAARDAVVALLLSLADAVQAGDLPADAALVVVSAGDVHDYYRVGHPTWAVVRDALSFAQHVTLAQQVGISEPTGADWAESRRAEQVAAARAAEDAAAARPYRCSCGGRFASPRGHAQHARSARRRWAQIGLPAEAAPQHVVVSTHRPQPRGQGLTVVS